MSADQPFAHRYAARDAHSPVGGDRIARLLLFFFGNQRFGVEMSVVHVLRAYIRAHRQLDISCIYWSQTLFLVMQGVHMLLHHACTAMHRLQYGGADRCEHMSPACQSTISSVMLRVIMPLPNSIANQQAHGAGQMAYDVTICSAGWCD